MALEDYHLLYGLKPEDREAMEWVAANTPSGSSVAVITNIVPGWTDPVSEWFPALTSRESIATPQGYEWIGRDELRGRVHRSFTLQECAEEDAACLDEWSAAHSVNVTHLYLLGGCCDDLDASLGASDRYDLLVALPGASIYTRLP